MFHVSEGLLACCRYGRVNVLRWMKEADMPALERTCNGALALHYAAARGCLDCVRLLVDASTDLGYVQFSTSILNMVLCSVIV